MAIEISVTGTTITSLGIVDASKKGMAILVRAASDLDGGTITISTRPSGNTGVREVLSTALDGADPTTASATFTVGSMMEVFATQSGASSTVVYIVSQY
jgi:hypothetical protein